MTDVQITVVVKRGEHSSVESKTLQFEAEPGVTCPIGRIIGDTARIVGEKAWYGRQQPTPKKEGGSG